MKMSLKLIAGVVVLSAACVEPDPVTSKAQFAIGPNEPVYDEPVYDLQPQCRSLLGSQLDDWASSTSSEHFWVDRAFKDGKPIQLTVVRDASLMSGTHVGVDPWFDGVIVSNGSIELQLRSPSGTSELTYFKLFKRGLSGKFDTSVCSEGSAIPFAGMFRTDGLHVADASRITFGCGEAAALKCSEWGYPAGPGTGPDWDAHQACTRMARADYWSNGTSHTRMETAIKIADAVPEVNDLPVPAMFADPTVWPPLPNQFFFEAAWWPGTHTAGCIGKVRWHSLPIGGRPDLPFADPRSDRNAKTCEDMPLADLLRDGALTFVASAYNDLALQTWRAATSGGLDYVTTVRGYHAEIEERVLRPFSAHHTYTFENTVGFLLRKIPGSITDPGDVIDVHIYREVAHDRMVLARKDDPRFATGFVQDPEREGYVFSWQRTDTIPFRLYRHVNGDYLSTVDARVPPGYAWVADIGWIMAPEPGN
jgi:hypothetical protein